VLGFAAAHLEIDEADVAVSDSYQARVAAWLTDCFGSGIARSKTERTHRFLEEALELAQAAGCTREDALSLVDYVFARPIGTMSEETGGVMVTLAGVAFAHGLDMVQAGEDELKRNVRRTPEIRAKRAAKRGDSPLPQ